MHELVDEALPLAVMLAIVVIGFLGRSLLAVRSSVEHCFDANRMVDEYLPVRHRVVEQHRTGPAEGSNVR
jgi:hypothetical protein